MLYKYTMAVSFPSGLTPWIWYDAADSSTVSTSGSSVTGWMNKGFAAGGSGSVSGTVSYGTTNLNGVPTIYFNADSFLTTPSISTTSQAFAFFFVMRPVNTVANNSYFMPIFSNTGYPSVSVSYRNDKYYFVSSSQNVANKIESSDISNPLGKHQLYAAVNSATLANNYNGINGLSLLLSTTNAAGNITIGSSTYKINPSGISATPTQMEVAEILGFQGEITVAQRQQIEGYLAWKWGLQSQLDTAHPYAPAAFTHTLSQRPLPKPWVWFDAADASTITKSGTTLTSIRNKGFAGGSASPALGTVSTGIDNMNGLNTITSTWQSTLRTTSIAPTQQAYSVFSVVKTGSVPGQVVLMQAGNAIGAYLFANSVGTSITNVASRLTASYSTENKTALYSIVNSAATTASNYVVVNGSSLSLATNTVTSGMNLAPLQFDVMYTLNNPATTFAEMLVFMGEMSVEQRQLVEGYLAWKWGLQGSLPTSHPFYAIPYINREAQLYKMPLTPWVWFDAADASSITKSGTTLTSITNKGSAGGSASVDRGTVSTSISSINGTNVLTIPGGTRLYTSAITPTNQAYSIFFVAQFGASYPGDVAIVNGPAYAISSAISPNSSTIYTGIGSVATRMVSNVIYPIRSTHIVGIVNSAATAASNAITVNGTPIALSPNQATAGMSLTATNYEIFRNTASNATVQLGELVVFMGEMTTAHRQQVEGYLAQKWGLQDQLPRAHPYNGLYRSTWSIADTWLSGDIPIPGCQLWLDASHPQTIDPFGTSPTLTTTWNTKTGSTSGTAVGSPIIRVKELNDMSVVSFRNTTDYISVANNFNDPGFTATILFKFNNIIGNVQHIFAFNTSTYVGRSLCINSSNKFTVISPTASSSLSTDSGVTATIGTWYIATVVYDLTGTGKLYINGTSYNVSTTSTLQNTTGGLILAAGNSSNANSGNIDVAEFMCFNRPLSATEVARIEGYMAYKWGVASSLPSTHLLNGIAVPPLSAPRSVAAIPMATGALVSWIEPTQNGGSAITGYRVIASPGSSFVDVAGDVRSARITGLTNGTSYTFTVVAKNIAGYGAVSAASAAIVPSANVAPVYNGGSYYFNGQNATGITVPNTADLRFGTGDFTIEWWQYWMPYGTGTGTWNWTRSWMFGSTTNTSLSFNVNAEDGIYFGSITRGPANYINNVNFMNTWKHIAVSRKDGFVRIFVDGKLYVSGTYTLDFTDSTRNLNIGSDTDGYPFRGFISQFHYVSGTALYTSEFIPPTSEIQPVANTKLLLLAKSAGTLTTDYSPVARTGITQSGVAWSPAGPYAPLTSMAYQRTIVSTFAGSGTAALTDATGTAAAFDRPKGMIVDASDNIYVADWNNKIRMITPAGVVSTLGGTVSQAQDVIRDSQGNLFATSYDTHQIYKQTVGSSTFVSFAGSTSGTSGYQDGTGSTARFNTLGRMAIDASDNLYVCDAGNHKIRRVTPAGVVSTFVGPTSGTASGTTDGSANSALLNTPYACAFDSQGNLFIADSGNNKIRKVSPAGIVSTFAGAPAGSTASGSVDGRGTTARFSSPLSMTIDKYDNLYVFDNLTYKIRKITPDGVVSTVIGPPMDASTTGYVDGIDEAARMSSVEGLAMNSNGTLFISNTQANRIRRATTGTRWQVQAYAGLSGILGSAVGDVAAVRFNNPLGTAVGRDGSVYIGDSANYRVIKITPDGNAVVLAGTGSSGSADGVGTSASFGDAGYMCLDRNENLFVVERGGHRVRKITPTGHVTTIAGTGVAGIVDGHGSVAQFNTPHGICIDASDNLYVADYQNNRIRKLTPGVDGYTVSTFSTAITNNPLCITCDTSGVIYVSPVGDSSIYKLAANGTISSSFSAGGAGIRGLQYNIYDGFLYYGSTGKVWRMSTSGAIDTSVAVSTSPHDMAYDAYGNMYVPDYSLHIVSLLKYAVPPAAPTLSVSGETISWTAPANNGLPITSYDVLNSYGSRVGTLGASATSFTAPASGAYRVRAINNAGVGDASTSVSVSIAPTIFVPDAPTSVSAVAGNQQATVSWTTPVSDGGAAITAYRVYNAAGTTQYGSDVSSSPAIITGLTAGQTYIFTVRAVNSVGQSALSTVSNSVLVFTTPGAPRDLAATDGSGQIVLNWFAPLLDGSSAVIDYRITDQDGTTTDVSGTTRTFTGLIAGRTYSYTVAARNAAGYGTSSASASRLVFGKPGAPRDLTATDGSGQIVLNWFEPLLDGSSAVIDYRITDQNGNTTDVSGTTRTFTDLSAGTTYSYTVAARNAAGYGTSSASASLLVFGKPGAPTGVSAAGGNRSAVITWIAADANSSTITNYRITASPGGAFKDVSGTEVSGTMTGLTNGTSYTFTVVATNAAGTGPVSAASNTVVPNAPPTGPFYVVNLASGSYKVGNTATTNLYTSPTDLSDEDGIPVGGYSYKWQVADVSSDLSFADITGATASTYVIPSAYTGKYIRAIVSYTDNAGTLETVVASAVGPIITTVPYMPTGVSAIGGDKQATVNWTAPNDGGLDITKYTIIANPSDVDPVEVSGNLISAIVSGLEVNTEYTFSVYATNANGDGASASSNTISTTDYPAALTFSSATAGNGSVLLIWSAPFNGGSEITSYTIYNITDSVQYTDISGTSYSVGGLTNDVEYTFAISATNANGEGPNSGGSISVIPYTVPDAPAGVLATSLNTGDIRVSWNAPADNGRPIVDYRITDGDGQTVDVSASPYTFTGLTLGRTYSYTVAARNVAGYSAESTQVSALSRTTPTAPKNLQAVAGIGSITLTWSAPDASGGATVSAYRVYTAADVQVGSDVSGLSTTVGGLANGTEYTFYVRAVNVAGESENSNGATATPRREPDAPTIVSVVYGNALIDLSWNAPAFNGGSEIIDYRVYYNGLTKDVSSGTSTTLTGLTNGTLYTIQVAARNVVGYGTLSDSFTATPSTVPDAPVMGTPVAASRRITVSWSTPYNGGAEISSYDLYVDGSSEPIETGITGTSYAVINLTNDVQYQFRVAAVNMNGSSELSAASTAIAPFNTPPTGDVDISGLIVEGAEIEMINTLADVDGIGMFQYKWFRVVAGVSGEIAGEILSSYTIKETDVGAQLFGVIYYTDAEGTNEIAYSETVGPVAAFAVQNLSAVAGNASVDLSWNTPETNGKVITGYRVRHHLSSVDASGAASQIVQDLSASVSGLTNGSEYTFRVAAGYDGTYGSESLITETPYTVPDAPATISTVASANAIRVSWTAPAFDGGRAVSGYDLSYNGQNIPLDATDLSYNITGLTNGQSYTIEVRARNIAGLGAAVSTSEIPYTTPSAPTITSVVAGNEQVSLQWTPGFDGGRLITGYRIYYGYDSVDVSGLSYTVESLTNDASYTFYVVAINAAGEGAQSTSVSEIPYTVPGQPTGLSATAGVRSVSLNWIAPADNGRAIDYYRVSEAGGATYDVSDGSTSLLIEDLSNGTTYTYTVAAHNLAGFSNESASDSATPRTIPDAITEIFAYPNNGYVDLSWNAPYNGGADITEYRIVYGDISGTTATTSFQATGLINGTTYVFYVYAINEAGSSLAQSVSSTPRTVPGTPTAPIAVPADSSITIYWDIPASNGGSEITGYRVAYGDISEDLSANELEYIANGLTNGQSYTFNIYAVNIAGESATPLSITATPRTTPGPVQNLMAVHNDTAVDLSWNTPISDGGSPIEYYRVSYDGTYVDVSDGTSTTIEGLTNGTEYTFSVAAYNVAGYGSASTVSATPSTLPGKPTITSAIGSDGSVSLSWSVADGGASILSSKIYYVASIDGSASIYDVSGSATSASVPGLTNGTYYLFAVESTNLNGTGPASDQSSPVAPYDAPDAPVLTSVVSLDSLMRIEWSHSGSTGGFALSKFVIYDSNGSIIKDNIDPAARTIDISENLTVGTSYVFKMKAFSTGSYGEVAQSEFSTSSSAVILGTVPAAPSIVDLSSGNATIRVSWSASVSDGYYAITKYTVYSAAGSILADDISASATYVDISVPNGVPIAVKMSATNQIGTSIFSASTAEVIPSRVPDAPTGLTATHGDQQIALSWTAPVEDGSANIIKYGVYYADGTVVDENVVDTSFNVVGLTNGQSYSFKVAAFNIRGFGAFSATASETPSRIPDAPPKPSATAGNRSAVVFWDAPAANGSVISIYEVYDGSGVKWADTSSTLVNISGLTNGVYYQFKVRAQNRDGFGSFSALSDAVRPNADVSGSVDISGIFMEGQTIEAVLNLSDEDGLPTLFNYQWQVASASVGPYIDISGAITPSFLLTSTYVRKYLRVYVSYTDLAGVPEEVYSGFVGPVNDIPSGLDISGSPVEGQTLVADFTNFVDQDGYDMATFAYQWSDSSDGVVFTAIADASASSFLLTQAQVDKYVRLVVSYTDNTNMPHVISATVGPVANINNAPVGLPLITGTVAIGQTVYTDFTPVSDLDGIDMNSLTYQWQIADAEDGFFEDVCGQTQVSFEIDREKVNQFLRVKVDYTDLYGASEEVISVVATAVPPTVPDAPTGLVAVHGDTYVDLSWNAPAWTGGIDLSGYIIYRVDGATTTEVGRTLANELSTHVDSLTNGILYVFQVAAYNAVGEGALSTSASETPSRPASAPQDISASHYDGYVSLSWSTPASDGGATITGYKVFDGSTEVASVGSAIRAVDISGLTNGVSYTFTVYAENRDGLGDSASVSVIPSRIPDAPASISAQHGNSQITVSWTIPPSDGGADILGYKLYRDEVMIADVNSLSYDVSGLTNGTTYSFYVRAYNLNGLGAPTETIQEYPSTTPSAPRDVSGSVGNATIFLTWSLPSSDGGATIEGYRIYEGSTLRGTAGPNDLQGSATGLTNGVSATVHVVAYNRSGEGTMSTSITLTPNGFASPVRNLNATSGNASVLLTWSEPEYIGGGILDYVVKAYSGATLESTSSFNGLSGEVLSLTNGTTYTFRVYARTSAGLGEEASISSKPYTTPGPVRMLQAFRNDGKLNLSWTEPILSGGDTIFNYRIIRDGGAQTYNTNNTNPNFTVEPLNNGQLYTFTVQAQNARGYGTPVDVSGTPSRAPDAITDASGSYGDKTATLSWNAPYNGGSAIQRYRVYLNGVEFTPVFPHIRSYTFEGLTNGTQYNMSVRAENHTLAANSNIVSQTPRTLPAAPTGIAVDPSRNLVRVSWALPDNGGAIITRFEVGDVSADNAVVATVSSATATTVNVTGLTNGQAYRFVVRAVNSEGNGPWSAPSAIVYPGDVTSKPTITSVSYENQAITVSWSEPTDLGGFAVDTYRIYYTGSATPVDVSGDVLTKKITGLTNGTFYQFTVYAVNFKGTSAPSDISTSIKPSRFPDAPAKPTVSGHGDGSITIQWSAPNDQGDTIQGYRVYIDGSDTVRANPLAGTTTATISGLTNGTNYQFRVHAYNRDGPSTLSEASDPEFPSRAPDAAVITSATHADGAVSLIWSKPANGGAPIQYYRIYRQAVGSGTWLLAETINNADTLTTIVSGIDNGTAYIFRVDTSNRDGTTASAASAEVVPSTIPGAPRNGSAIHGDGTATLGWIEPSWNGGNAVVGYRVFDISSDVASATPIADVSGLSADISGLTIGTTYVFKVLAYNINGQGPVLQLPAVIPSRVPDNVVSVSATPGNGSMLLRWNVPYNGGAPIIRYRVYESATNTIVQDVSGSSATTALITGLTNGQSYSYKIKAANLNGFSTGFSANLSGTPFTVDLEVNLPPKQQETIVLTTVNQEPVPLTATTVDNNLSTGVVSAITSDPTLSNVMVAGLPTEGPNIIDEVVIGVSPKTEEYGVIIAVNAFQVVQDGETITRTSVSDFTENPLTFVISIPGETAKTLDVYTRPDDTQEFVLEGKAYLISAAANTYSITVSHLTEFAFKKLNIVPCFPMGTRVLTAEGYKAIEKLTATDRIITSDGRPVAFARAMELIEKSTTENAPYLIPAHTFGYNQPPAPITLSPHHAFQSRKGVWQIPLFAAQAYSQIKQVDVGRAVLYFHLKLPNYLRDNVVVEGGVIAESYGGSEYGTLDTIYTYNTRLGGFTRRSTNKDASKAVLTTPKV